MEGSRHSQRLRVVVVHAPRRQRISTLLSLSMMTARWVSPRRPTGVETFASSLARMSAYPAPHYVLFTTDIDPQTQQLWCPDCARSVDAVRAAVWATGGTLLEASVGQRPAWKSPDHPFR